MATTRKTGERSKRTAKVRAARPARSANPATDPTATSVLNKLRIGNVPVVISAEPPVLPPYADVVEVHAFPNDVSIVFARLPFQVDFEKLQAGGEAVAIPVSSVTMTHDVARSLVKLIKDAMEAAK